MKQMIDCGEGGQTRSAGLRHGRGAAITALLAFSFPFYGVVGAQAQSESNLTDSCIEAFDAARDYFPHKTSLTFAENFSVTYHGSYKVLTVEMPYVGGSPQSYVLLQCGAPSPELGGALQGAPVIEVPIATIYSASTTHNPLLDALGRIDALRGTGRLSFLETERALERAAEGLVVEFGLEGAIDIETVIAGQPDVLMTGGTDVQPYAQIRNAGISIVANSEWLEPSGIAQAEWIKYMALFFNEEERAEHIFEGIARNYREAAALVAEIPEDERPIVLSGAVSNSTFFGAGGRSYVAQSIRDAGGRYVFADNADRGSTPYADLEVILAAAAEAEFWINAPSEYRSLADIQADEPRLATLPAVQAGQVWAPDRLRGPNGGMMIYQMAVLNPDLVLRDLIEIFHPGLIEGHELLFYRPIELE